MSRTRDTQRKKCYTAESAYFTYHAPLLSLDEVREQIARIHKSERVVQAYRPLWLRHTAVHDGRGHRSAMSYGGTIALPCSMRMRWVVLHEMAHEINRYRSVKMGDKHRVHAASHGWEFCAIYLDLVMWWMGKEAHDGLKASFKKHKVKFTAPRKGRVLTLEQRIELAARLHNARAAKAAKSITQEAA